MATGCVCCRVAQTRRFIWSQATSGSVSLSRAQLSMLLEGIDWRAPIRTAQPLLSGPGLRPFLGDEVGDLRKGLRGRDADTGGNATQRWTRSRRARASASTSLPLNSPRFRKLSSMEYVSTVGTIEPRCHRLSYSGRRLCGMEMQAESFRHRLSDQLVAEAMPSFPWSVR